MCRNNSRRSAPSYKRALLGRRTYREVKKVEEVKEVREEKGKYGFDRQENFFKTYSTFSPIKSQPANSLYPAFFRFCPVTPVFFARLSFFCGAAAR
jgi:hypothetical protein